MKPTAILEIRDLYGDTLLAGSASGKAFFSKLVEATQDLPRDAVIALNFSKIDVVTASFFREAFRAFRDYARSTPMIFPIFTNTNAATREEIAFFAEGSGDAFAFGTLTKAGDFKTSFILGKLDSKQSKALMVVVELGEADAGQLLKTYPEVPEVSSAAWSNRLAALAAKGFVIERLVGRTKKYRPITEELTYGS